MRSSPELRETAKRGPHDAFRYMGYGDSESDEVSHLVVSEAYTALDIMMGGAEPIAVCSTAEDAQRIVRALNAQAVA